MPFSFFGLVVRPGKTYSQRVSRPFRVTMATYGEKVTEGDRSCVKVQVDGETYVLCVLSAGKVEQQPIDVVFEIDEEITFSASGENVIYLTGNYLPEEHVDEYENQEMDSEDEINFNEDDLELASGEEVSEEELKKLRASIREAASSSYDDEDDSDFQMAEYDKDDDDNEIDSSEDLEDELEGIDIDEDMESSEEEEKPAAQSSGAAATGSKRKPQQRSAQQTEKKLKDNAAAAVPTTITKTPAKNSKTPAVPTPSTKSLANKAESPAVSTPSTKSPAKKAETPAVPTPATKPLAKKAETPASSMPVSTSADAAATPKKTDEAKAAEKKTPKSAPAKTVASTPVTQTNATLKVPKTEQKKIKAQKRAERKAAARAAKAVQTTTEGLNAVASTENKKQENKNAVTSGKKLESGLTIEDIKVGDGEVAMKGKTVSVRYVGKLVKHGKVFDKKLNGKPYNFVLGQGEVIKGLDIGIENMKAGGERRLIIPASLAYGREGSKPDIPKNAALEFEVKLIEVK